MFSFIISLVFSVILLGIILNILVDTNIYFYVLIDFLILIYLFSLFFIHVYICIISFIITYFVVLNFILAHMVVIIMTVIIVHGNDHFIKRASIYKCNLQFTPAML